MPAIRWPLPLLLFALLSIGCDSSGWTNPPGDDDTLGDDDTTGDDDTVGDDDTGDDDTGDDDTGDDDSSGDDDSAGDDDDTGDDDTGDDDDSTPVPGDADGDGFAGAAAGGADCDDSDDAVFPGAIEDPGNSIDDDCDGTIDEQLVIISVAPASGYLAGGTLVTVTGTGITALTGVTFGTNAAPSVSVTDDISAQLVSPAGAVGAVDLDLSSAFETVTLSDGFRYTGVCSTPATCLDSAVLPVDVQLYTNPGVASAAFDAVVTEPGLTDAAGAGAGILAEIGYGPQGWDPTDVTLPDSWTWSPASYSADSGSGDSYSGTVTPVTYGTYMVTFRFSDDGGDYWLYADSDASNALRTDEMSQLHVTQ